jgi:energy-converting hydrogenase Eha subunit E
MKTIKRDQIVGVGIILVAIFFFYHTSSIRIPANITDPGPRLLPYLAQAMIIICSVGMIIQSARKKEEEKPYLTKEGWMRLGIAFFVLIAYAIALTYVGFIWATPFMAFVLITMLSGEKKIPILIKIVAAIAITVAVYFIFSKGFSVMLPQGKF